jgi:tetratricopeptide (TPR) repeat protein
MSNAAETDPLAVVLPTIVKRLEGDDAGRELLRSLADDPAAAAELSRWLAARGAPTIANVVTGGVVGKLVNIAHADVVHLPPERTVVPPVQLPADIRDFTDREVAVAAMLAAAADPATEPALLAISGVGGSGKSALAVHVGHRLAESRSDGQLYVSLRGGEGIPADPAYVLDEFLRALGVEEALIPAALDDRARLFRAALAGRRMLVLLDNAADEPQVRPLLPGGPGAVVIVTSRAPLAALEAAVPVPLDVLEPDRAVELLATVAGRDRVGAEPEAAREVAALCGGLPLALRVAGARLVARPHWRVEHLARRLRDERGRLAELAVGDLDVRGSFMLSYRGLDKDLQRAFRRSGLAPGIDFPAWLLAALLDSDVDAAEELAERLVEAQLLEVAGEDQTGELRYRLHDLVRVFARERLEEAETEADRHEALARALGALLGLAKRGLYLLSPYSRRDETPGLAQLWPVDPALAERLQAHPYDWFSAEYPGLIAGIRLAHAEQLWECTWELADALHYFFRVRALWADWQQTHELALDAAERAGNQRGMAWTLRNLGNAHRDQQHLAEAESCFQRALELFRELGNRLGSAAALNCLGELAMDRGRLGAAVDCFGRCLPLWAEVDDRTGVAYVNHHLGVVHRRQGLLAESEERLSRSRAMFHEMDDGLGEAFAHLGLGDLRADEERWAEAGAAIEQAVPTFVELGDRVSEALALVSRARVHLAQAREADAAADLARAIAAFREVGHHRGEASALTGYGDVYLATGEHTAAAAAFEESAAAFAGLEDGLGEAVARFGQARVLLARDDRDRAGPVLRAASERFAALGAAGWQARAEALLT